jgi:glycosyltransferase 2 family protein
MARILRLAGSLLAVALCAVVLYLGGRDLPAIGWDQPRVWANLGGAFLLYTASQVIAAAAWRQTLAVFSVRLPQWRAETQLLVSQIGKYIPGNVAHLLGRIALTRADGVAGAVVGLAMLVEICLVLVAGGLLLVVLLLLAPDLVGTLLPRFDEVASRRLSILFVAFLVCGIALGSWFFLQKVSHRSQSALRPLLAFKPLALHVTNFLILGLSLALVMQAIVPGSSFGIVLPVAVFVAAWTIGFLTPGSPGGIGVREGLIVLGIAAAIGEGPALAVALVHRALAVGGDVTAFLLGLAVRMRGDGLPRTGENEG